MLSSNDRLLKIATADAKTLARVDMVLTGEDTATATFHDEDCRTVTFTDAAKRLKCSRPTVYGLVKSGRLDAVTFCGINRITMKSINEFASGNRPPDAAIVERMRSNALTRTANARSRRNNGNTRG